MDIKETVKEKLLSIKRPGMPELVKYMEEIGYFESPASTRFHGAYKGGLVDHCHSVYNLFSELVKKFGIILEEEDIIICSYLHDLCKVGAYINGSYNRDHPPGHATLSLNRIEKFIELEHTQE